MADLSVASTGVRMAHPEASTVRPYTANAAITKGQIFTLNTSGKAVRHADRWLDNRCLLQHEAARQAFGVDRFRGLHDLQHVAGFK